MMRFLAAVVFATAAVQPATADREYPAFF